MTRAISFTKASVRRAIAAAREAGLRVKEIRQDGTLVVEEESTEHSQGEKRVEPEREIVF